EQTDYAASETAVRSVAPNAALLDGAEPSGDRPHLAGPDRAVTILEESNHQLAGQVRVSGQLAVLPAGESLEAPDPERPVARDEQAGDVAGGERLVGGRLPGDAPDTIEAKQAELGAQPEVAVLCLGEGEDRALGKAVADLPRRVAVLADVQ